MKKDIIEKTGRKSIDSPERTTSFSRRAMDGKLIILKGKCPACGHHKIMKNTSFYKCARCKIKKAKGDFNLS